jgi:hypothetical protein
LELEVEVCTRDEGRGVFDNIDGTCGVVGKGYDVEVHPQ